MQKFQLLTLDHVLYINQEVCDNVDQRSVCLDKGKIESALGATFYPGHYPFQHGGIAKVAGALCFFLTKAHGFLNGNKRTAMLASTMLLDINHYNLVYPANTENEMTALTDVIQKIATSELSKEELMMWYDQHKQNRRTIKI